MNDNSPDREKMKLAALAYALAVCRGAFDGVLDGDFTAEDIRRTYDATAASRIADAIGLPIDIEWNDYLTEAQKHRIAGHYVD